MDIKGVLSFCIETYIDILSFGFCQGFQLSFLDFCGDIIFGDPFQDFRKKIDFIVHLTR